jgi:hypothetical protein
MPTSGTTSWSLNRDQVITAALRKLGVLPSGGVANGNQIADAQDSVNALVKTLQADGMPLWKLSSQTFTTVAGNAIYTVGPSQTVNCPKPLKILQAEAIPNQGVNYPLNIYTSYDYNQLPQVNTQGIPVDFHYQPLRTTGIIKLWPIPQDSLTAIVFYYHSPFEDMPSGTTEFDFPSEWMTPFIYMLAWMLAPEYGIPPTDRMLLQKEAEYWHQLALSFGSEEGSITFRPEKN